MKDTDVIVYEEIPEDKTKTENYILPKTEKTINTIIADVNRFFKILRICFSAYYLVFLTLRAIFFSRNLVIDIILLSLYVVYFVLILLEFKQIKFLNKLQKWIFRLRMIPSFILICLICVDIFSDLSVLQPWQVISFIIMGLGWLFLLVGDLFNLFVPSYTKMILDSFKEDINARSLLNRVGDELKPVVKEKISEAGKEVVKAGVIGLYGYAGAKILKNIFKKKGE